MLVLSVGACENPKVENPSTPPPHSSPTTRQQASKPATGPGSRFDASGFPEGPGHDLVVAHCTACHSGELVQQNRATREGWREIINWMQKTQNLWQFDRQVEEEILDYLGTHYGRTAEADDYRRPPLPLHLMPPTAAELASKKEE
jgi:uncharacterized protein YjiS (DUF1127 family)